MRSPRATRGRIETQVKERHGLSMEDYLEQQTPEQHRTEFLAQEAAAREDVDDQRDHAEAARHAAMAAHGDRQDDTDTRNTAAEAEELWDYGDSRASLADKLMAAFGGTQKGCDGVRARLAADRDQRTHSIDAVRSTKRGPRPARTPGAGRDARGTWDWAESSDDTEKQCTPIKARR